MRDACRYGLGHTYVEPSRRIASLLHAPCLHKMVVRHCRHWQMVQGLVNVSYPTVRCMSALIPRESKTILEAAFGPKTILGKPPLHGTRIAFPRRQFLEPSLEFLNRLWNSLADCGILGLLTVIVFVEMAPPLETVSWPKGCNHPEAMQEALGGPRSPESLQTRMWPYRPLTITPHWEAQGT